MQIGMLEDTRNRTLHGILRVQSCFRGHQARLCLKELRRGIVALQSCIALLSSISVVGRQTIQKTIELLIPLLFFQLSGERKSERNMRMCCKDIELLLLYKGRLKAGLLGKSSRI